MQHEPFALSGHCFPQNDFCFYESPIFEAEAIINVLLGKSLGCIFRNVIAESDCQKIARQFWQHPLLNERNDGVPAYNLGSYHYNKNLHTYLQQTKEQANSLSSIFLGVNNYFSDVVEQIRAGLHVNQIEFRPATYLLQKANEFVVRSCQNNFNYVIEPHDDIAQCQIEEQRDFEIQQVINYHINSLNICLENQNEGALYVWNLQADDQCKKHLGIEKTGYPYPHELLNSIQKVVIPIHQGDIYCLNSRFIHAVKSSSSTHGFRTTLSCFMGQINPSTIVYWT